MFKIYLPVVEEEVESTLPTTLANAEGGRER